MLQMRRSRLFAELRTYFESGRGCFAKASTVVIMRACSSTVEQGTHNPLVLGSNPGGPTKTCKANGVTRWPFLNMSRTLSIDNIGPGLDSFEPGSGPFSISTLLRRPRRVSPTLVFAV